MSEILNRSYEAIPTTEFSSAERRTDFERHHRTALGNYAHEFTGHQTVLFAVDAIGDGVAAELNTQYGSNLGFRSVRHPLYDNPDGTFSTGYLLFGAKDRSSAEAYQGVFVDRINEALEALEANVRLDK